MLTEVDSRVTLDAALLEHDLGRIPETDRVRLLEVDDGDLLRLELVDHVVRVGRALDVVAGHDAEERRRSPPWFAPLASGVRVADGEICAMPAAVNEWSRRRRRRRSPAITASTFGSEMSFWETVLASPPPFSIGRVHRHERHLEPVFRRQVLTPNFAHDSCSVADEAAAAGERSCERELDRVPCSSTACEPDTADEPAPAVAASAAAPSAASASAANPRLFIPCSSLVGIPL